MTAPTDNETLRRLYRDTVLRHSREPHNCRRIDGADASAEGHNPLCGDRLTLYLRVPDDVITEATFEASGCAISLASASMLTDMVTGRSRAEAQALSAQVQGMLSGRTPTQPLGEAEALSGVSAYPSRVRCATLPWRTLQAALGGATTPVSTESGAV